MKRVLTFTNLFPSALQPHHGRFVQDRMRRVTAAMGCDWQVVHPVPKVPRLLRHGVHEMLARMPATEPVPNTTGTGTTGTGTAGTTVHHVPYPHLPGFSLARQAERMAAACLPVVQELCSGQPTLLDVHYFYPDGVAGLQIAAELDVPAVVTAR